MPFDPSKFDPSKIVDVKVWTPMEALYRELQEAYSHEPVERWVVREHVRDWNLFHMRGGDFRVSLIEIEGVYNLRFTYQGVNSGCLVKQKASEPSLLNLAFNQVLASSICLQLYTDMISQRSEFYEVIRTDLRRTLYARDLIKRRLVQTSPVYQVLDDACENALNGYVLHLSYSLLNLEVGDQIKIGIKCGTPRALDFLTLQEDWDEHPFQ